MRPAQRGTALPETALMISLALLLVLGTAQMTLIGWTQMSADGAAFIAARTAAVDPGASPGSVVAGIFPNLPSSSVNTSAQSSVEQSIVQRLVPGFTFIGGSPNYTVGGGDAELIPSGGSTATPSFSFGATANLYNYCPPDESCTFPDDDYSMYVAQNLTSGGNGSNGNFSEWYCHADYFQKLVSDFGAYATPPPVSAIAGTALDVTTPGSDEYEVYSWDTGSHACQ